MIKEKKLFLIIFIGLIFFSGIVISVRSGKVKGVTKEKIFKTGREDSRFREEKITYDIKMGRVNLGKAIFRHLASTKINGRMLNKMTFETNLARFKDTEIIYSDPRTLLPVRINRNIINWFNKEKITEDYDQKNFTVTITKYKGTKQDKTIIKKNSAIHNAILLPHYVRRINKLDPGYVFPVNLPSRKLQMKLVSIEDIKTAGGVFKTYHFESLPKQIEIWISADEYRIPIKMQGIGAFGYLMVLKEYAFRLPKD
jgi:hypothetical protein